MSDARQHDGALVAKVSDRYLDITGRIDGLINELRNLAAVVADTIEHAQDRASTVPQMKAYAQWAEKVRVYLTRARTIPEKTWRQMESGGVWVDDQEEPEQ